MQLIAVITILCISLSVMLTPCASQHILVQSSHNQAQYLQFSVPPLPRKLRLIQEAATSRVPAKQAKVNGGKELQPYKKLKGSLSGNQNLKEASTEQHTIRRTGTRQEWMEGTNPSQFFTMDYSSVRRRRPIHNKSLPVAP